MGGTRLSIRHNEAQHVLECLEECRRGRPSVSPRVVGGHHPARAHRREDGPGIMARVVGRPMCAEAAEGPAHPGTFARSDRARHRHMLIHVGQLQPPAGRRRSPRGPPPEGRREVTIHRTVADVMTRDVVSVHASAPFRQIVWQLRSRDVSAVPVVDPDGRVIGIVSEADLLLKQEGLDTEVPRFIERRKRRKERAKARGKRAQDLMTSPAVTVGASALIAEAARLMHGNAIKRLPVVDDRGRLLGIVSRADLIKVFLRSEDEIQADVEDTLALSLRIHPSAVLVSVRDGVVRLEGRVTNKSEVAAAVNQTRHVDGVVAVESELDFEVDDEVPISWMYPSHFTGP